MSRQQDLLFCKIAVTNGMVTEEQAKKCLALVNKREQESGRRPQIGAIFSKYNLLQRQQVQIVYDAVNKRLGGNAVPAGGLPASARERGKQRTQGRRGRGGPRDERAPRKVDPTTLWLGIGFGVVFLGIIIGLAAMFFGAGRGEKQTDADDTVASESRDSKAGQSANFSEPGAAGGGPGGGGAGGGGAAGDSTAAPERREMSPEERNKIRLWLTDARSQSLTDEAKALELVEQLRKAIVEKSIFLTPDLESEIADFHAQLQGASVGAPDTGGAGAGLDGL